MNIEFKRDNVFIKAVYNLAGEVDEESKIRIAKCDCGYYIRDIKEDEFISISKCPNCGTKIHKIINSRYDYPFINRVEEYKFTNERGYLKNRKLKIRIEETEEHPENLDIVFDDNTCEFIFEYEINKRNKKVYKPKVIKNGEEQVPLLKGSLRFYDLPGIYYDSDVKQDLKTLNASGCNNSLEDTIWGINNRYKYLKGLLDLGIYYGYCSEISELRRYNDIVLEHFNEDNVEIFHKKHRCLSLMYGNDRILTAYDILANFHLYYEFTSTEKTKEMIKLEDKKMDVIDSILERANDIDAVTDYETSRNLDSYSLLISELDFTIDEIIELYNHLNRQAYNINNLSLFVTAYYTYKKLGIPIDKKPKECAIYYKKMLSIHNLCQSCDFINNVIDTDGGDKEIKLSFSSVQEAIKTLYNNNSYKILDDILINAYMNERCTPYCLKYITKEDGENKIYNIKAIGYSNSRCYEISAEKRSDYPLTIVTENNEIIDNEKEIKDFLRQKKREMLGKEVSSC